MLSWTRRYATPLATLLVAAVNIFLFHRLFFIAYTKHMGSIEASFISLERYMRDNLGDLTWFPLWFSGMPFQNVYQPGLHYTVALAARLTGASPALAYHFITAAFLALGPVTVFWMARVITRSTAYSLCAGLLYSVTSPINLFSSEVRHDVGRVWFDRRMQALVQYGEGPHVSSLTLVPIALLTLWRALEKPTLARCALASCAMAAVVLTNWPGGVVLASAVIALGVSGPVRGWVREWAIILGVSVAGYCLAASWVPPSTIVASVINSQKTGLNYGFKAQQLLYVALLAVASAALLWLFERWGTPRHLRFFALFAVFMSTVTMSWFWAHIVLTPQPHRFHLAMEMALILTLVFSVKLVLDRKIEWQRPAAILFALLLIYPFLQYRRHARDMLQPIDVTKTSEYKTAIWLRDHLPTQRVMVPGSTSFWMNTWNDTAELTGCCEPGIVQQPARIAAYVTQSDDGVKDRAVEISKLWFVAFGVQAVATSGPRSTETFHPFHDWKKFEGHLPVLWRDGDDVLYKLPLAHDSLAHVMAREELVSKTPVNGIDTEPLEAYVRALEDTARPLMAFRWINRHDASITGPVHPGQAISVQIAYHPAWKAQVNGAPTPIRPDGLAFMAIEPACDGECTVTLHYDGGREMAIAQAVSLLALGGVLLCFGMGLWRR